MYSRRQDGRMLRFGGSCSAKLLSAQWLSHCYVGTWRGVGNSYGKSLNLKIGRIDKRFTKRPVIDRHSTVLLCAMVSRKLLILYIVKGCKTKIKPQPTSCTQRCLPSPVPTFRDKLGTMALAEEVFSHPSSGIIAQNYQCSTPKSKLVFSAKIIDI